MINQAEAVRRIAYNNLRLKLDNIKQSQQYTMLIEGIMGAASNGEFRLQHRFNFFSEDERGTTDKIIEALISEGFKVDIEVCLSAGRDGQLLEKVVTISWK